MRLAFFAPFNRVATGALALLMLATAGPAAAEPRRLRIDPAHSQLAFSVERFGFNRVLARIDRLEGEWWLDEEAPERSSVQARWRLSELSSGDPQRDEHLRGPRWFQAAVHPEGRFRSTAVVRVDARQWRVQGELTLLGRTQPVELEVQLNRVDAYPPNPALRAAGASATARLSRQAFGLQTAAGLIGDEVRVQIELLGLPAD